MEEEKKQTVDEEEYEEYIPVDDEEEECDPITMDCTTMPQEMEKLIRQEISIEDKLGKLDVATKAIPEQSDAFKKIYDDLSKEKQSIETKINDITTHFAMCRPPLKEEETPDDES